MNKYLITSLAECGLYFNNPKSASSFANEHGLNICKVYYLDEHTPKLIGFGIENENGLCRGDEFVFV